MLTPTFLHHNATASSNGAGATIPALFTVGVPAHQFLVVRASSGALGASNGETDEHSLSGIAGLVKLKEVTRLDDTGGFRPGVTVSLWALRPSAAIAAGVTLTLTCSASVACRALTADTYDCGSSLNTLALLGVAGDHGSTGGASFPAVNLTPADWDDAIWLGVGAFDGDDTYTVPLPSGWAWDRNPVLNGGNNFTGLTMFGQYRIVEALQQIWTVNTASDRRWGMILAAYSLTAPVAAVVEGARQLQADFDTPTDGNIGTSVLKRPDAVGVDYLTATSIGPVALEDTSGDDYTWKARATVTQVLIARRNAADNGWEDEEELFAYTGPAIADIFNALTFDRQGKPLLAAERPTGASGAPEVWLYWFNPDEDDYVFEMIDAGRTPKLVLDRFPHVGVHCAPSPDVQLVYLKPGTGDLTGLVRRESRDDFETIYATPLPYVPNIWLEAYFPTLSRRLQVRYSRRHRTQGTYELRHVDSLPFPDSLLLPSRLFPENSDDILFNQGTEFLGAPGQVDVEQLRVGVSEDVDAIEVGAATTDLSLATGWQEQEQELDGAGAGYLAGASVQFPFTISHGDGAMSPRAFRARTRKQIGDTTCWSPWLYWFAGKGTDALDVTLLDTDDDARVATYLIEAERYWLTYIRPGEVLATRELKFGSVTIGFQQVFDPGIGAGWVTPFRVEVQGSEQIGFDDIDGHFAFPLLSRIHASSASANPWLSLPELNPNQSPGAFPPNPSPT